MRPKRSSVVVDHRGDLIVVANVGGQGEHPRTHRFDLGGRLLQRFFTPSCDDDVGAAAGHVQCDGTADTGSAAGHQGDRAAMDVGPQHVACPAFRVLDLHQTYRAFRRSD